VDPTDFDGQFADKGSQYRTAIFYHTPEQKKLAELSKDALVRSKKFATPIASENSGFTTSPARSRSTSR
jgi:peptide methionine sulfoxide reductase MsrA